MDQHAVVGALEVDGGEYSGATHISEKIFNAREGMAVLYGAGIDAPQVDAEPVVTILLGDEDGVASPRADCGLRDISRVVLTYALQELKKQNSVGHALSVAERAGSTESTWARGPRELKKENAATPPQAAHSASGCTAAQYRQ